jgi:hypothetical protein
LLQEGVVVEDGPTLDEVHQEEQRSAAEVKARKDVALEAAMSEEDGDSGEVDILAAAKALDSTEKPTEEETQDSSKEDTETKEREATAEPDADEDLTSLTVAELKARLKSAGKPVSGKKDELISRLQE